MSNGNEHPDARWPVIIAALVGSAVGGAAGGYLGSHSDGDTDNSQQQQSPGDAQ